MKDIQSRRSAYIIIETEKCKGCRYCISVCPRKIIGMASHLNQLGSIPVEIIPAKADQCTGCAICALMCPDCAISVFSTNKETAIS